MDHQEEEEVSKSTTSSSALITFDAEEDDESLSLSDLPVSTTNEDKVIKDKNEDSTIKSPENEEFEFRSTWGSSGLCVADEVFFKGQILPLRPSISSDTYVFGPSRSSSSSSRSSSCISRSHSSSSSSTGGQILAPRAHAISNNFYAHPSPSPQLRRANAGRRSTGSAPVGWSVFRLGLVQAPEIEIHNLRARRVANVESSSTSSSRSFREVCFSSVVKGKSSVNENQNNGKVVEEKKGALKFFGLGFACKCSPESVEKQNEQKMMMMMMKKKKKKSSDEEKRGESVRQRRIFEWLEELSVARMMV